MKNLMMKFGIFLGLFTGSLFAQDFDGKYILQANNATINLTFMQNDPGVYEGELSGSGLEYFLSGTLQNGWLAGFIEDEAIMFQAQLNGTDLTLVLADTDIYGNVVAGSQQTLIFQKSANSDNDAKQNSQDASGVIVNGISLSQAQVAQLEQTYGVKPIPGKYWYDNKSGLYGVVGFQAYGFMYPGHNFGAISRNASNGNTGVFVNGRELPQNEWAVWSYIIGSYIQPGAYWLDSNGNAGYQGNPIPTINLYAAARQNSYRGQGSGGDNFWSSRFSAGNYDRGNSRGYVSVPGYGPVGYGFD